MVLFIKLNNTIFFIGTKGYRAINYFYVINQSPKMKILFLTSLVIFISCFSSFGQLQLKEAKLGKGIENRVLTEESSTFPLNSKVYMWMKFSGGTGNITINWKNGTHTHSNSLTVGGDPWRTWAFATAYYAGEWTVSVTDDKGAPLKELTFTVQ